MNDISLRDYFAGQALNGAMTTASGLGNMTPEARAEALNQVAALLYEVADAMLKAREAA